MTTMYALLDNNSISAYPYSLERLRADNPATSFPLSMSEEELLDWSVVPVQPAQRPEVNHTMNVIELSPVCVDGSWHQVWATEPAAPDQIAERTDRQASAVRATRTRRLSDCDWTQLPDAPVDPAAWATYRQALRDITSQSGFPWEVEWPLAPGSKLIRARNELGQFVADDPATPEDEAWVEVV